MCVCARVRACTCVCFLLTLDTCLTQQLSWPNLRAQHKTGSCLIAGLRVYSVASKTCPLADSIQGLSCFCCPAFDGKGYAGTLNLKLIPNTSKGLLLPQFLCGTGKGSYDYWEILKCDWIYLYTGPGSSGPQGPS